MLRKSFAALALLAFTAVPGTSLAITNGETDGRDPVAARAAASPQKPGILIAQASAAVAASETVDVSGRLHVPKEYRSRYRYMGSWAVAADDKGSKEIHVVYSTPDAVEEYAARGHSRTVRFW